MKNRKELNISELFYSIQGEGVTTGVPSFFLRLAQCQLNCGVTHKTLQKIRSLAKESDYDYSNISLIPENNSTWVCDTIPVWIKGEKYSFQYVVDKWKEENIFDDIKNGTVHIIWTGGEPTMKVNQESINSFLIWLKDEYDIKPFSEIETNGGFYIEDDLFYQIDQINCSPKLSNSGHTKNERIIPEAIKRIMEHDNYWFKFVISTEEDIKEMFEEFIVPFNISLQFTICMPGLSSQDNYFERTNFIMEMAKKYKFIGLSRQHIASWNSVTGV